MPLMAVSLLMSCGNGGGNPGPVVNTYTITFDCQQCKAYDENNTEVNSVTVSVIESERPIYQKFHFGGSGVFKTPLKSSISVKKTGTEDAVDYKYANGEVFVPLIGNLTISAKGTSYSKDLEESSWDEIAEIAETGRADEFFDIYDPNQPELNCKKVYLTENGKVQSFPHLVRIIDFNHDDLADGTGKAGITFEFANLITKDDENKTPYLLNWDGIIGESGNNFNYRNSVLNTFLNDETEGEVSAFNMLPDDLNKEGIIKPVNKLVGVNEKEIAGKDNYKIASFETKLFSLAYDEIHNPEETPTYVTPGEAGDPATGGGVYEYYKGHGGDEPADKAYRIKRAEMGTVWSYWLRSPVTSSETGAHDILSTGDMTRGHVYLEGFAVCPAFCI